MPTVDGLVNVTAAGGDDEPIGTVPRSNAGVTVSAGVRWADQTSLPDPFVVAKTTVWPVAEMAGDTLAVPAGTGDALTVSWALVANDPDVERLTTIDVAPAAARPDGAVPAATT